MKGLCYILGICFLLTSCSIPCWQTEKTETQFLLNTVCTIRTGGDNVNTALNAGFSKIKEVQKFTDFYNPASTVAKFNEAGANIPISLDTHTERILELSLMICKESDGAFDITIAPVQSLWNFNADEAMPPNQDEILENLKLVSYENLILDTTNHTLTKTKEGVKIDLGGVAKGYAAEVGAKAMDEAGAEFGVLDLGGNIAVFGENPNRKDGKWQIGIQKPFGETGEYKETVTVASPCSVVTSGVYQRYFKSSEKMYHHILDPKTGYPAINEADGVTIVAESSMLADCLSTACFVLDKQSAENLAKRFGAEIYFTYEADN